MLKKLLNRPEQITYDRLREVCARHSAQVYAKVRLADVLPIEDSGLGKELFEFALQAHYDFVVTGRDQVPLFAIEFDGPQHSDPLQAARDKKKDDVSERFKLTLIRVAAGDLQRTQARFDRLTELIEMWFEYRAKSAGASESEAAKLLCPQCGAKMVEKPSKYGRFLSCSRYPACSGARDLPRPVDRANGLSWKTILVTGSIGASLAGVVLAVYLYSQGGWPRVGGASEPARMEMRSAETGQRTSLTLEERQAYASALRESDYPACPICQNRMVLRQNSKTGDPFFGCSEFPRCRGTRDVQYPK